MGKKVIVIGSGFAGLSAATHLANKGYDVTILEKNDTAGGRARMFEADGFRFDIPQGANDPDFMLFVVIASEADHLPNAEARHLCSKAWLTKCDQEELDMKSFYSKDLSATCKLLIERFSPES